MYRAVWMICASLARVQKQRGKRGRKDERRAEMRSGRVAQRGEVELGR